MSEATQSDRTAPAGGASTGQHAPAPGAAAPLTADPRAAVGRRIGAGLLDLVALWILAMIVSAAFGGTTGAMSFELTGGPALVLFALAFAYYIVPEGLRGQTPGKMLVGIKVLAADGSPAGWGAVVVRNLLRIVDGIFFYLVGLIVMLSTQRKQRVGDLAAKTIVVRTAR